MPPSLTIITGASSNHFLCLQSLLWSISHFEPAARVIVYDIGLTANEHSFLQDTPPFHLANWELRTFDFSQYPPHFAMNENAGYMAFRPITLAEAARSPSTLDTRPLTLLWLDAGCQLREPLHAIQAHVKTHGVYCPCTPGEIQKTLHPAARAPLGVTDDLLPLPIRDAGTCAFDPGNPQVLALLDHWAAVTMDKNCTAPEGSRRRTNCPDAVFAVLLNQAAKANHWTLGKRLRGLAIKQDTVTLAETKFRTLGP